MPPARAGDRPKEGLAGRFYGAGQSPEIVLRRIGLPGLDRRFHANRVGPELAGHKAEIADPGVGVEHAVSADDKLGQRSRRRLATHRDKGATRRAQHLE